jgi:pimeloyl-ACP methyl ester carboxylesterase
MEQNLENATIHYEQFGKGKPVILLHGQPTDHRHMVKDFEVLAEEWLDRVEENDRKTSIVN